MKRAVRLFLYAIVFVGLAAFPQFSRAADRRNGRVVGSSQDRSNRPKARRTGHKDSDGSARVYAIKLVLPVGQLDATRVVIFYGNGQQHYENRAITLKAGQSTNPIGERTDSLIVEAISLFHPKSSSSRATTVQIWGEIFLQGPSPPNTATSTDLRPRGEASPPILTKDYREIGVLFGTTRLREPDRTKAKRQIATFSGEEGKGLTLGRAIVTVPIEREIGSIPRPDIDLIFTSISLRSEDPKRDFTIAAVDALEHDAFVEYMKKQVEISKTFSHQAFLFIHGFNVSFEDALFRTAQIAQDIGFDGPIVSYSWPSRGAMLDYKHDVDTAKSSRDGLLQLLSIIAEETGVEKVNVIAHSMGNDPLLEVLSSQGAIIGAGGKTPNLKLNEILLAAPDVGRRSFEQLTAKFVGLPHAGVTLYASANDKAMVAAKRISDGIIRAGDVPARIGPEIVAGVDTIDVSDASTEFFGLNHSAFAERAHLVEDIRLLFAQGTHPPDARIAIFKSTGVSPKQYWRYLKN